MRSLPILGLFVVIGVATAALTEDNAAAITLDEIPGESQDTVVLTSGPLDSDKLDQEEGLYTVPDKVENGDKDDEDQAASRLAPSTIAKRDLATAATGYGVGGGQLGGFGAGYGGGGGYGGGYEGNTDFGGAKKYTGGNQFGGDYGDINKNVKLVDDQFANRQHGAKGFKGSQGFNGQQGRIQVDNGNVNKVAKKGHFGSTGGASKTTKNDGSAYGNNNFATKFVKGARFGNKGVHKKGHITKGFRNTYHKDEAGKNHQFHDIDGDTAFFNKHGDEGAFTNNLAGKQFFDGHHTDVLSKNNQGTAGNFITGHHNLANKGQNTAYGSNNRAANNANFGQYSGQNHASGIGKGVHANNNHGGSYGGGGFGKLGGAGGSGHSGGFYGGAGNFGGTNGGYGFGGLGGY